MIEIVGGNALDKLKTLLNFQDLMDFSQKKEQFDFIFFDADKENLIKYFDLVIPFVRIGGILAADNALFPVEYRADMEKYLIHIKKAKNIRSITLPIGNGEELSIKLR
jgi:caffeoyl-CoA O-methyltransferase